MRGSTDPDTLETGEWIDSLRAVLHYRGPDRAAFLIEQLTDEAQRAGASAPFTLNTPYVNTIPPEREERANWDRNIEHRIRSIIRWNAVAIVLRANKESSELGGHIASFQSAATLYDIGFGHFWRAPSEKHGGDLVYIQGHSAPGIYARAFVEGRLGEQQLLKFRQETGGKGLSSYPHPWLMPELWQFPTVSMGLGPLMAIYQARFLKYLHGRGIETPPGERCGRSWATARWTSQSRSARFRLPGASGSTTLSTSSTVTCSASMGRCAAMARSCRS
jgi:pyruvate dehydrogenase E1 component